MEKQYKVYLSNLKGEYIIDKQVIIGAKLKSNIVFCKDYKLDDMKLINEETYWYLVNRDLLKENIVLKETNKELSKELTKDKVLKQECITTCCGVPINEIPKLQQRIDKAIEYIINKARNNCLIDQYDACDLLQILKGESNE